MVSTPPEPELGKRVNGTFKQLLCMTQMYIMYACMYVHRYLSSSVCTHTYIHAYIMQSYMTQIIDRQITHKYEYSHSPCRCCCSSLPATLGALYIYIYIYTHMHIFIHCYITSLQGEPLVQHYLSNACCSSNVTIHLANYDVPRHDKQQHITNEAILDP